MIAAANPSTFGLAEILAILLTLTAGLAWLNRRFLKLPPTIGLMALSLGASLLLVAAGHALPGSSAWAEQLLAGIDFDETLLHGMLGFLLFAGALHVDLSSLARQRTLILVLASFGVMISTALVGGAAYAVFHLLGIPVGLLPCLVFGALISPTDPIAVLAILKTLGVPKELETQITGESLFNDGVGVVVFLALVAAAGLGGHGADGGVGVGAVALLFAQEVIGGALLGLGLGLLAYFMLRAIDDYTVEILTTLALVAGGFALADALHLSGPIMVVVAGLLIGNHGRSFAMSARTREHLDLFWELVDEILNALLFVLIGLEILVVRFEWTTIVATLLLIPLVVGARLVAVGLPIGALRSVRPIARHTTKILTWGGLRGGISVALALSLPRVVDGEPFVARNAIVAVTYGIVVFSILVQGLTIGPLIRELLGSSPKSQ